MSHGEWGYSHSVIPSTFISRHSTIKNNFLLLHVFFYLPVSCRTIHYLESFTIIILLLFKLSLICACFGSTHTKLSFIWLLHSTFSLCFMSFLTCFYHASGTSYLWQKTGLHVTFSFPAHDDSWANHFFWRSWPLCGQWFVETNI